MREIIARLIAEATGKPEGEDSVKELDSLEFVELLREIENHFAVRIPESKIAELNSVDDFVRVVGALVE